MVHPLVKGKDEIACPRGWWRRRRRRRRKRWEGSIGFHVASADWKIRTVDELSNAGSVPRRSQDGPGENPWRNGFKYIRGPHPAIAVRLSITFHQRLQKMGVKYAQMDVAKVWRLFNVSFFYFFSPSFLRRFFLFFLHSWILLHQRHSKWNFIIRKWMINNGW